MIVPPRRDKGVIHKEEIPKISKKAIKIAITNALTPAHTVLLSVAKGTNRAIMNKTKSGATTKFTTRWITSNRLPVT